MATTDEERDVASDGAERSEIHVRRIADSLSQRSPAFQDAWERLYAKYHRRLVAYADKLLGPALRARHDPEDFVQKAWGRAAHDVAGFEYRGASSLLYWLMLQVRRSIGDLAKKSGRRAADEILDAERGDEKARPEPASPEDGPSTVARQSESRALLESALQELPVAYREVLHDYFFKGLGREEVARKHGRLPNTVSQQLKRGLALLKDVIEKRYGIGAFDSMVSSGRPPKSR